MKKIILTMALKFIDSSLIKWALEKYVYPKAREFVLKSTNKYDDKILKKLEKFLNELADDYDNKDKDDNK